MNGLKTLWSVDSGNTQGPVKCVPILKLKDLDKLLNRTNPDRQQREKLPRQGPKDGNSYSQFDR